MNLWKSLRGYIVVELTSADVPGAMSAITASGIVIHKAEFMEALTVRLTLDRRDLPTVKRLAEKRGEKLLPAAKKGLYWSLAAGMKRPVLLSGLIFVVLLGLLLPTRVLFIRVEGNDQIPARQILAAAEACGIRFGANRRQVRSEKMKNALLGSLPQLQWAGVNTAGCVATISVRERGDTQSNPHSSDVSSIVAARDGVVLSCTITAGTGQCIPGQAVQAGQVLISGYTDCGLLIKATRAEGEIFAQTRRTLSAVALCQRKVRGPVEEEFRQYSLILGKKRINFENSSRICDTSCGRMYEEYYITLPGGFVLPVALAVQTHICRKTIPDHSVPENMQDTLAAFARHYLTGQMITGSIQQEITLYEIGDGICTLDADYLCQEMIGRRVQEGKVDVNGESD